MKAALVNAMVVGSGGFLGALARYGLSGLVHRQLPIATFPYGTLAVNLLGCFGIGVMAGLAESGSLFGPDVRRFALIGLLGGFTTFSMIRDDEYLRAAASVALHVVLGLLLVWLGYALSAYR